MSPQPPLHAALAIQQAVYGKRADRRHQKQQAPVGAADAAAPPALAAGDEITLALKALQCSGKNGMVARTACGAVQDLLRTEEDCRVALEADAVPLLSTVLVQHGACPDVMTNGLAALLRLLSIGRAQFPLTADRLAPLLLALRQHRAHRDVMALGVAVLVQLATTPRGRSLLFTTHAIELAIEIMLTHPKTCTLQCLGCELVHHLAAGPDAQERLLAMGAVETLVEAVRQFPSEAGLQHRALYTLCRLCETEGTRAAIGRVDGVAAIVRAVDGNHTDLLICRYGCALLWELSLNVAVQHQIMGREVKAVVKKVLNDHSHDVVLLTHGRALLWRISGHSRKLPRQAAA